MIEAGIRSTVLVCNMECLDQLVAESCENRAECYTNATCGSVNAAAEERIELRQHSPELPI